MGRPQIKFHLRKTRDHPNTHEQGEWWTNMRLCDREFIEAMRAAIEHKDEHVSEGTSIAPGTERPKMGVVDHPEYIQTNWDF
jgi:hypothetical protein